MTNQPQVDSEILKALSMEYQTLRTESLNAISQRVTVLSFSFAALGVFIGGLMTQKFAIGAAAVLAYVFVPQLAKVALLIWIGEYERSQRAGAYIRERLEPTINGILNSPDVLGWEKSLSRGHHMSYPYLAPFLLLVGAGWVSVVLGISLASSWTHAHHWTQHGIRATVIALIVVAVVWELACTLWLHRRFQTAKSPSTTVT